MPEKTMTMAEYRKIALSPKPKHKYNVSPDKKKRTVRTPEKFVLTFQSQLEARFYEHLREQEKIGGIMLILRQLPFDLPGGIKYRADFIVFTDTKSGNMYQIIYDVKGCTNPKAKVYQEWKRTKKMVEAIHNVKIVEVTQKKGKWIYT